MTTIRYFIPEDGDSEYYPNVFLAPKPRQQGVPPTLGQVRESFPLPGRYHFRFKSPLVPGGDHEKGGMAVWMDCVHDSQMIPTWKNTIIAKVSRVAVEDEEDDDDDFPAPTPQQKHVTPPPPRHMGSSDPLLDVFDQPASSRSTPSLHGPTQSTATADLLNSSEHPPAPSNGRSAQPTATADLLNASAHAPAPSNASGTLLDMDAPMFHNHSSHSAHNDFLGMTAPATTTTPSQPYGMQHQQQARPQPVQAPRSGGVPMQQRPMPQQPPQAPRSGNAFDSFSVANSKDEDQGPFGGLAW